MSDIETLRDEIKGIRIVMLTTVDQEESLRSRPMGMLDYEFAGDLWFFTSASEPKVAEVKRENQVNVAFADPSSNRYVSVSGIASIVPDRARMEKLWHPIMKAWFPDGLETPDIALLRVSVHKAEYWDFASAKIVQLIGFVKAVVTGEPADGLGKNEKLNIR
ncbi:MAG: pyridoxamine 5'-phosphate oxidase family protein [Chloroflexota bacterium]